MARSPRSCEPSHAPLEGHGAAHSGARAAAAEHAHEHGHAPLAEHDRDHDHDHEHGAAHAHEHGRELTAPAGGAHVHRIHSRRALLWCIVLTTAMMVLEVAGGLWTDSLMLLSDAAHMASHALALLVSYVALRLAARPRGARTHYGLYRAEIIGAFVNGLGLLGFTGWIAWQAILRFQTPESVQGGEMTAIAALGLLVNLVTAWILAKAGAEDLNTKSAFLHMLADTLSSVAIVIGGAILWWTGALWIDPALSLLVAAVVIYWGFGLLRESLRVLLEFSPKHIEPEELRSAILSEVPEVREVHDLHVWEITSGYVCLTAHLVVPDGPLSQAERVQRRVQELVARRFRIGHATLQLETHASAPAAAAPAP